jgi:DNA-binding MarR family transcriptional regulator
VEPNDDELALAVSLYRLVTWTKRIGPPSGLSATAASTIDALSYLGPLRVSELAEREGVTQPAMTSVLNKLEQRGYAERTEDPSDGRATLVQITAQGVHRLREARAARARIVAERLAQLAPEDRDALEAARGALDRLLECGPPAGSQETVSRPSRRQEEMRA